MLVGGCAGVAGLLSLWVRLRHRLPLRVLATLGWLWRLYTQLSLRAKIKQMMSFYQVATRITEVYDLELPGAVVRLLESFDIININIEALGLPLQCLGLGSYGHSLAFTMFAPLLLAAAYALYHLAWPCLAALLARDPRRFRRGRPKEHSWPRCPASWSSHSSCSRWSPPPPSAPSPARASATGAASSAPTTRRVRHGGPPARAVHRVAGHFPVPCGHLGRLRDATARRPPRARAGEAHRAEQALGFLVRDFDVQFMWWELLMAWRQLWLVGFAVLSRPAPSSSWSSPRLPGLHAHLRGVHALQGQGEGRVGLGLGLGLGLGWPNLT